MLINFKLQNYKSFQSENILDLETTDLEDKDYVISSKYTDILPVISIFGANDSGKTNLIDAFKFVKEMVTHDRYIDKIPVEPFSFDKYSEFDTTKFEFVFVKDNIQYIYGFILNHKYIYNEYLYEINANRRKLIFLRDVDGVTFEEKGDLELGKSIQNNIEDNELFLPIASRNNYKPCQNPFKWFCEDLIIYEHIDDNIFTVGRVKGQTRFNRLADKINNIMKMGGILIIDMIEKDLHPLLVENLMNKFLDKKININSAQLIFTTHNVDILARKLLRKDQIYFINKEDMSSELYSLSDFINVENTDSYYISYMLGKYDAIPDI
ncbi:MAG: AAA family ATPase [Lachnospirales bacterium]